MPSVLFENPWPLGLALGALAAAAIVHGLREGRRNALLVGAAAAIASAAVFALAALVTTSAEHGERVVREIIAAVEAGDAAAVMRRFAPDATVHVGSDLNPGLPVGRLADTVAQFLRSHDVESIVVTGLRTESAEAGEATVHLGCLAETDRYGPSTSQWIFRVARDRTDPEAWRVVRFTWTMLNGQPARGYGSLR